MHVDPRLQAEQTYDTLANQRCYKAGQGPDRYVHLGTSALDCHGCIVEAIEAAIRKALRAQQEDQ